MKRINKSQQQQPQKYSNNKQQQYYQNEYQCNNPSQKPKNKKICNKILIVLIILPFIAFISTYIFINANHYTDSQNRVFNTLIKSVQKRLIKDKQKKIVVGNLNQYLKQAVGNIEPQLQYIDIQQIENVKQLPFCVIIDKIDDKKNKQLLQVIRNQNYSNYKIVNLNNIQNLKQQQINYFILKQQISKNCLQKSLLLFPTLHQIRNNINFFKNINKYHQKYNIWATFHINYENQNNYKVQLISTYDIIFNLTQINDFDHTNIPYLQKQNKQYRKFIILSILQLCAYHTKILSSIQFTQKYKQILQQQYFIGFSSSSIPYQQSSVQKIQRLQYQSLHSLSQDHPINLTKINQYLYIILQNKFNQSDPAMFNRLKSKYFTPVHNLKASQYQQIIYLPSQHILFQRQYRNYKYIIQNDPDNYYNENNKKQQIYYQNRICVTVLNRNNIQHNRYIKLLKSIIQQNYTNYHIVFLDDVSTDNTLQKSLQYTNLLNSHKNNNNKYINITYIKNKQRKYATYNIFHAAYHFCEQKSIQLLVDGDDQLIGSMAFKYINNKYNSNNNTWIVYSGYKDDTYRYGYSEKYTQFYKIHNRITNTRRMHHLMSPIRTWKVQLVRKIPFQYNKLDNLVWFQSGYDNAIQLPLFQLAGVQRIKYVKQMLYLSKRDYGDNDDATLEKRKIRDIILEYVQNLQPLEKLDYVQIKNVGERYYFQKNLDQFIRDGQNGVYQVIQNKIV